MAGSTDPRPSQARGSRCRLSLRRAGNKRVYSARAYGIAERLAAKGYSDAFIARSFGEHPSSFRQRKREDEELVAALERGRAVLEAEVADLLLQAARGGNIIAMIFLAKARCGWREGDVPETAHGGIVINLPAPVDAETWLSIVSRAHTGSGSLAVPPVGVLLSQEEKGKKG
jgi:hypothetical protein